MVAGREADFCLTGTTYFCLAATAAGGALPARFAAALHQTSPLAALVAEGSDMHTPADLAGRRLGGAPGAWLTRECLAALAARNVGAPTVVDMTPKEVTAALGRGEVDLMCTFADALPSAERRTGIPLRAIALGSDVYASGLAAGDHVAADVASRMHHALADALRLQDSEPGVGVEAFCRRYPETTPDHALSSWAAFAPFALTDAGPASMDEARWRVTVAHTTAVHGLAGLDSRAVYRPELARGSAITQEVPV